MIKFGIQKRGNGFVECVESDGSYPVLCKFESGGSEEFTEKGFEYEDDEDQVRCGCEKVTCMGSHFHSPDFYDEKEMIRRWDERA